MRALLEYKQLQNGYFNKLLFEVVAFTQLSKMKWKYWHVMRKLNGALSNFAKGSEVQWRSTLTLSRALKNIYVLCSVNIFKYQSTYYTVAWNLTLKSVLEMACCYLWHSFFRNTSTNQQKKKWTIQWSFFRTKKVGVCKRSLDL